MISVPKHHNLHVSLRRERVRADGKHFHWTYHRVAHAAP